MYYAEIDENSMVKAVLETNGVIDKPTMISTDAFRSDLLGWTYANGQFYPPPTPPVEN
jgi:hypothetical protein